MTKQTPSIFGNKIEKIKEKIQNFLDCGYSIETIIKITKNNSKLFSMAKENIQNKINDLLNLGYTKEEVLKMTTVLPTMIFYSIESIKEKIKLLISSAFNFKLFTICYIFRFATLPGFYSRVILNLYMVWKYEKIQISQGIYEGA